MHRDAESPPRRLAPAGLCTYILPKMLSSILGTAATLATLPGTVELLGLTAFGALPARKRRPSARTLRKIAVVVPAHDEEAGIARCVSSLLGVDRPGADYEVVVIADNCSDATAQVARDAGATVWERTDPNERGKGYALDFAFSKLLGQRDVDAVLIVDADTDVDRNFVTACEATFEAGADAVQCRYLVRNPGASRRTQLMQVAVMGFNVLRPRGRERLGLSAGILGNGWGMTRECLVRVPYSARSVVEDLEHHIELVRSGIRVHFVDDTAVHADMPVGDAPSSTQRARWEGGRLRMIVDHVPRLLWEAANGRPHLAEPALELMLLPLAYHVAGLSVALVIPFPPTQLCALGGLSVVGAHVATAIAVSGGGREEWKALAGAPAYMLWKANMLPRILRAATKQQSWVRTAREPSRGSPPTDPV